MMRVQASAVLFFILMVAAGLGADVVFSSSIPKATVTTSASSVPEYSALQSSILANFDNKNYPEAARQLSELKTLYEAKYTELPYKLLHAKVLLLSGNKSAAFSMYQELETDP